MGTYIGPLAGWNRPSRGGAIEEQFVLPRVAGEQCGALEFHARLLEAPELLEEITAHARQQVVVLEEGVRCQSIDQIKARFWPESHAHRDGAIEFDHR